MTAVDTKLDVGLYWQ